jgi:uncharacterized protein (DUF849 family)
MELIRRAPQGSSFTYQSVFRLVWPISAMCIALGQHVRAGIEENLRVAVKGGPRCTTVEMIRKMVRMADELGRAGRDGRKHGTSSSWAPGTTHPRRRNSTSGFPPTATRANAAS